MSDRNNRFPTVNTSVAIPSMIICSPLAAFTDFNSVGRIFQRCFLTITLPAMVTSLPVSTNACMGLSLCSTVIHMPASCSVIGRTFRSILFLSASESFGHCQRRCLGSPHPQHVLPVFRTLAFAELATLAELLSLSDGAAFSAKRLAAFASWFSSFDNTLGKYFG